MIKCRKNMKQKQEVERRDAGQGSEQGQRCSENQPIQLCPYIHEHANCTSSIPGIFADPHAYRPHLLIQPMQKSCIPATLCGSTASTGRSRSCFPSVPISCAPKIYEERICVACVRAGERVESRKRKISYVALALWDVIVYR